LKKRNLLVLFLTVLLVLPLVLPFLGIIFNKLTNKKPSISVIVPVYNTEEYLTECLESVTNQTFKNIEIICVNDGSTDGSLDILEKYQKKDSRIIVIDSKNGGVSSARNKGIKASRGDYITFVDSDDYLGLDTYEKCFKKIKETESDILVFDWEYFPTGNNERKLPEKSYINDSFNCIYEYDIANFVCNKLFKRSLITENNIFFNEKVEYCEDDLFTLMVVPKAKNIILFSQKFYHYRQRSGSASSMSTEKMAKSAVIRASALVDYWREQNFEQNGWLLDKALSPIYYIENLKDKELKAEYSSELLEIVKELIQNKEIAEIHLKQLKDLEKYSKNG
jgi:glycosyltransferase involved in cell wall biosynthesis